VEAGIRINEALEGWAAWAKEQGTKEQGTKEQGAEEQEAKTKAGLESG
jgi:hypothetical protein